MLVHMYNVKYLPICKWSDNQTFCASQVLILVIKIYISYRNPSFIQIFFKIESTLLQPFKVIHRTYIESTLVHKHIFMNGFKFTEYSSLRRQRAADENGSKRARDFPTPDSFSYSYRYISSR